LPDLLPCSSIDAISSSVIDSPSSCRHWQREERRS
jgi:hypothetical protein